MKKLKCSDLGGPVGCDQEIAGNTFDEMGANAKAHVMLECESGDADHKAAAERMKNASPEEQQAMMAEYRQKFEDAPEE